MIQNMLSLKQEEYFNSIKTLCPIEIHLFQKNDCVDTSVFNTYMLTVEIIVITHWSKENIETLMIMTK